MRISRPGHRRRTWPSNIAAVTVISSDFGDNLIKALPDVIGQTIGNAIAGRIDEGPIYSEAQAQRTSDNEYQLATPPSGDGQITPVNVTPTFNVSDLVPTLPTISDDGMVTFGQATTVVTGTASVVEPIQSPVSLSDLTQLPLPDLTSPGLSIDQVRANRKGTTSIVFAKGLTAEQFNAFLSGDLSPDADVKTANGGAITSNQSAANAGNQTPSDAGGGDFQASPQLDQLVEAIGSRLYNYQPNGDGGAEKFITIGTNADGQYVITSLQILGDQGGTASVLSGTVAIAHTHSADGEYEQPDQADNGYANATNRPSFVIAGQDGSNIFEIGRSNGVVSVRTITSTYSPGVPGPWEAYHKSPESYKIYSPTAYPPKR